jgi:hypothetical protein
MGEIIAMEICVASTKCALNIPKLYELNRIKVDNHLENNTPSLSPKTSTLCAWKVKYDQPI